MLVPVPGHCLSVTFHVRMESGVDNLPRYGKPEPMILVYCASVLVVSRRRGVLGRLLFDCDNPCAFHVYFLYTVNAFDQHAQNIEMPA